MLSLSIKTAGLVIEIGVDTFGHSILQAGISQAFTSTVIIAVL